MSLIHDERAKLSATYLNGIAIATIARAIVGSLKWPPRSFFR
ncbi:MAG: hypothetical protein ABWY78_06045 [Microvirga sp.]